MTCTACAVRIEKRLNRLDAASAQVNDATDQARVTFPASVTPAELVAQVEAAGYAVRLPETGPPEEGGRDEDDAGPARAMRIRLLVSAGLALPVLLLAMVPPLQFTNWQWLSLTLAAPVVVWGAAPFHRAAWANLRHGAATMDTLISVGTLAAFGWSVWALFGGATGRMTLVEVVPVEGAAVDEVLRLVGAVEEASEHPVARAVADGARARVGALPPVEAFTSRPGRGVQGLVAGHDVFAGQERFLAEQGLGLPPALAEAKRDAQALGHTAIVAGWDGAVRALVVVADTVKPTSARAVAELRALGLRPMLLTGDNERAARTVGAAVGIDEVVPEVLPADKVAVVRATPGRRTGRSRGGRRRERRRRPGPGRPPARHGHRRRRGHPGFRPHPRPGDLRAAVDAIRLSRRTLATIKGDLAWAFASNAAALPLAAAGYLNPLVAGAAMAFSSVFVVSNSLRLRRFRATAQPRP